MAPIRDDYLIGFQADFARHAQQLAQFATTQEACSRAEPWVAMDLRPVP